MGLSCYFQQELGVDKFCISSKALILCLRAFFEAKYSRHILLLRRNGTEMVPVDFCYRYSRI